MVSANVRDKRGKVVGIRQFLSYQSRNDVLREDKPCSIDSLVAIEWTFTRRYLAVPILRTIRNLDEQNSPIQRHAKTGFKRAQKAHADFAQFNLPDPHGMLLERRCSRSSLPAVRTRQHSSRPSSWRGIHPAREGETQDQDLRRWTPVSCRHPSRGAAVPATTPRSADRCRLRRNRDSNGARLRPAFRC